MKDRLRQKMPRVLRQMVKYGMVGAVATAVDLTLLNASHHAMNDAKSLLWLATAIGYSGGTLTSYTFNSRWTFRYDTRGKEARKLGQFAIVSLMGMGLTMLIVLPLVHVLNMDKNLAKLPAIATVFFWNFTANKLWTFRKVHGPQV